MPTFAQRTYRIWLLAALALPSTGAAEEVWPRFRGPNGAGVGATSKLPSQWTEAEYAWKVELPGIGHSSPVVWGQKIFITSGDEETGERIVLCIEPAAGEVVWKRTFTSTKDRKHQLNSFASATPAVDARHLYVTWATPHEYVVLALDHAGKEKWRVDLGPYKTGHGSGGSPIVHEDLVVVGNDQDGASSIVGLDSDTGAIRWRVPRKTKTAYITPCVYHPPGRPAELIFTNWEHGIMGIDPVTGATNWELQTFDQKHVETAIGSPIVAGDLVLGTCGWLGVATHTVAVRPAATTDGKPVEAYRVDRSAPLTTTPLAAGNFVYLWADEGIVACVAADSGELHWRKRVGGTYYGSPVAAGDYIYCASRDGEMVVLAAGKDYELIARNPLGEGSHSTPAIAHGRMYIRTFSHLLCLGAK